MKFEMTFYRVGVGARLGKEHAKYHEIWLAESMKVAWNIWAILGQKDRMSEVIEAKNWKLFLGKDEHFDIMDKIARFNRITRETDFDFGARNCFEQGWLLILKITSHIKKQNYYFEPCDEITFFRNQVTRFIANGIRSGLEGENWEVSEFFLFKAKELLSDHPIQYDDSSEVSFFTFTQHATVTATGDEHHSLECTNITVELL